MLKISKHEKCGEILGGGDRWSEYLHNSLVRKPVTKPHIRKVGQVINGAYKL
jgi:hypothetical protein